MRLTLAAVVAALAGCAAPAPAAPGRADARIRPAAVRGGIVPGRVHLPAEQRGDRAGGTAAPGHRLPRPRRSHAGGATGAGPARSDPVAERDDQARVPADLHPAADLPADPAATDHH